MRYIWAYLAAATIFFPLDFLWLEIVAKDFYRDRFGPLIAEPFNIPAAVGFYAIYLAGIVIFAIAPALKKQSLPYAIIYGALFGFFCYATYDMTNLATLQGYPPMIVPVDIAWGTFLTGASAAGAYLLTGKLPK